MIYENYGKMHSILANAVYGKDLTQLQATVQVCDILDCYQFHDLTHLV